MNRFRGWAASQQRGLLSDLPAKLLALLAALVLWFYASADRRAIIEQSYDVTVTARDNTAMADSGVRRAVSGLAPQTVKVTLRGRPERLKELRGELIEAAVDLTDLPEGNFNQPVEVAPPSKTEIAGVNPDRVQGLIDVVRQVKLPIAVNVLAPSAALMPNYQIDPAYAVLSGPSRMVDTVTQVTYAPVALEGGETREVNLLALDADGQPVSGVTLQPARAQLSRVDRAEVPVKAVPVQLTPPPAGLKVTLSQLSPEEVRLIGPASTLDVAAQVVGTVDYHPGTYEAPVRLLTPSGTQALDEVTVKLEVKEVKEEGSSAEKAAPTSN